MVRNRWEIAIRCLEVALHPHTGDDEIVAAVNGFRRTAAGTPLREVCAAFAATDRDGRAPGDASPDRLSQENFALRRQLEAEEATRSDALRRLKETTRHVEELREELRTAQSRAREAQQQFAELRAAYAETRGGLNRREFAPARRPAAEKISPPFRQILAAASAREPWTA
jgi:hypothetical protein